MKKIIIITQLLLVFTFVNAQQLQDSLQKTTVQKIKETFPNERIFNIEYSQSLARDLDSELFDQNYQDGKIKNQENLNATVNFPIYDKNRWKIIASGNYQYHKFEFENSTTNLNPVYFERNGIADFHYISSEIKMIRFSKLFNTPIVYLGSIKADGTEKEFGRVKGSLGFSLLVKRSKRTKIGIGAMAFIDPSEQFPYIPTLMLSHQFNDSKWELDMLLPDRVMLQRPIGNNGRLSLGTTLGNTGFYIENNRLGEDLLAYSQLELKTGIMYEHRLNKFLIASFRGGVQNFLDSRLVEKGEASSDAIYTNSQDMTGYFQVGISILPFGK